MEHTATPFSIKSNGSGVTYIVDEQGREIAEICSLLDGVNNAERVLERLANAEFIVKACNSFSLMVSALHMAKHVIDADGTREQLEQIFNALEAAGERP